MSRGEAEGATPETACEDESLLERMRAAIEMLEAIDSDRGLLLPIPPAERQRFLELARRVADPDHVARRRLVKAAAKARKAAINSRDEQVLGETGIRELRRKPVFTSPNVYPPVAAGEEIAQPHSETADSRHCYTCKRHFFTVHHFYDQLCSACGDLNFAKRTE
jgi:hypothetical protein